MSSLSVESLPDRERELVKAWNEKFEQGKDRHEATRRKAERYYALYRSYKELKKAHGEAKPRDVDTLLRDQSHGFGSDLFIPYVFSTIETTLARMLGQDPTMKVRPAPTFAGMQALMDAHRNSDNHRVLLEKQIGQIDYHLTLQDVGRSGLTYGIGWGKTYWQENVQDGYRVLQEPTLRERGGPDWVIGQQEKLVYSGPMAECCDLFDLIHDPRAHDVKSCRWIIHRHWFDREEVRARIDSGMWQLPEGVDLEADVFSLGSQEGRSALWAERMAAQGMPNADNTRQEALIEVWECHDGQTVTTILGRAVPVQHGRHPYWHGELPFQIFRPTRVMHEMLGIGEPEAIEDLQEEMNVLRTQRRDNAAFVLQRPFAYFDGMVDADDFAWAPGVGLPVDGDPSNLIHFFPVQDIPASGYQEEANLQRDIERVTGIDDTLAGGEGGGGASATATGVQMVQQAAGVRIANKTKRLEREFVKHQTKQFLCLNQQKILRPIFMPGPPRPDDLEGVERGWSGYEMGPKTLAGDFDVEPDDGSMGPPNKVQQIEEGSRVWETFGQDPYIDPKAIREWVLTKFGFDNPLSLIRLPEEQISPDELLAALEMLAPQLGIPVEVLAPAMEQAVNTAKEQAEAAVMGQQGAGQPGGGQPPQGPPTGAPA